MNFLLPHNLDRHAAARPDAEAVRFAGAALTWSVLADRSDRLARLLGAEGVQRGDRVGIYMDKCLETPVALYGIMKAGAAYVPLDPSAPPARIGAILRDCEIRHLVTANGKLDRLAQVAAAGTVPDCLVGPDRVAPFTTRCRSWDDVKAMPAGASAVRTIESDLAYVIYTSGSTGVPKGIMHTHHSGLSFAQWAAREYGLTASDRVSNHAPLHFDLSIFDYFAAATAGAATIIIGEEYLRLPASYSQLLATERISVLFTVPFALIQLLSHGVLEQRDLSALRWILFGGEPFATRHLKALIALLPQARFDNMYGPAEVNGCTHFTVTTLGEEARSVPIGPVADIADGLIVDAGDKPVAIGDEGELLVRTPTMMRGYWRRDDLNARAFFRRRAAGGHWQSWFRTGDLVRELPGGDLEFLGRKDRQVKVRGYRVELDEVESALAQQEGVEEAAAWCRGGNDGTMEIRAAVTLHAGANSDDHALRGALATLLPWYALPAKVSIRSRFPRTTTGKIDRRALKTADDDVASHATETTPGTL